jgi:hypothetical protein
MGLQGAAPGRRRIGQQAALKEMLTIAIALASE